MRTDGLRPGRVEPRPETRPGAAGLGWRRLRSLPGRRSPVEQSSRPVNAGSAAPGSGRVGPVKLGDLARLLGGS